MPRGRRKAPVQPIATAPEQAYGQGVEQMAAQRAIPLPDAAQARQNAVEASAAQPPAGTPLPVAAEGGAAPPGAAPQPSFTAALDAARMMSPPTGTLNEVMAGGVPQGPQMLDRSSVWADLALATGDPSFLRLAQQARLAR